MLDKLEQALGYTFQDRTLLENALTHSSWANENKSSSNERLEFLGDSILGFVVAEFLYRSFPDRPEGELTRFRAELVCEKSLAQIGTRIGLGGYLRMGHGEEQGGGRTRPSIVADAVESVLAAAYLDGGFPAVRGIIDRLLLDQIHDFRPGNQDYKTRLQELVQREKDQELVYQLLKESGPDHDKTFYVSVLLNGKEAGSGTGHTKKRAEQAAAHAALQKLFPQEAPSAEDLSVR